jgi:DNA-directed RNA polymerase II subunit RPB1
VCHSCAALRLATGDARLEEALRSASATRAPDARFVAVTRACASRKKCPACGANQPTYDIPRGRTVIRAIPHGAKIAARGDAGNVPAEAVALLLRTITPEDLVTLGIGGTSPADAVVIFSVVVPPPAVRPCVSASSGSSARGQDPMTHLIRAIIMANNKAASALGLPGGDDAPPADAMALHIDRFDGNGRPLPAQGGSGPQSAGRLRQAQQDLQAAVTNLIDGGGEATGRGSDHRSISELLRSKVGRVREDLCGCRCDFTGRAVITGDPFIDYDEVGMPERMATTFTFPERVTAFNYTDLCARVRRGPGVSGGATRVLPADGEPVAIQAPSKDVHPPRLRLGDVVERHLKDGDVVVMNRQPTLHKASMGGHRVKIVDGDALRLHFAVCKLYNADFDGDEMNVHVPQTQEARAEVLHLLGVTEQMVNPASGAPSAGCIQSAVLGLWDMCRGGVFLTRAEAQQALMLGAADARMPAPCLLKPVELWTGKQIVSAALLPRSLDCGAAPSSLSATDACAMVVRAGEILAGALDERAWGSHGASILRCIIAQGGTRPGADFITNATRLGVVRASRTGVSLGIDDVTLPPKGTEEASALVLDTAARIDRARGLGDAAGIDPDAYEPAVKECAARLLSACAGVVRRHVPSDNSMRTIAEGARSKGSVIDLVQCAITVGQQTVGGERLRPPPSVRGAAARGAEARGLSRAGYARGLGPAAFVAAAQGGREGLVDTGNKTAGAGYTNRKIIKTLEGFLSGHFGSVRDERGRIVSFRFGDYGYEGSMVRPVYLALLGATGASDASLASHYRHAEATDEEWERERAALAACRDAARASGSDTRPVPYDCVEGLTRARRLTRGRAPPAAASERLTPSDVLDMIDSALSGAHPRQTMSWVAREPFEVHMRASIGPKAVLAEHARLGRADLEDLIGRAVAARERCILAYGDPVGFNSGFCLGKLTMQLTLNSKHHPGMRNVTVQSGVPRLICLLSAAAYSPRAAATSRTPHVSILALREGLGASHAAALAADLPNFMLTDAILEVRFVTEDAGCEALRALAAFRAASAAQRTAATWVSPLAAEVVLDRAALMARGLGPEHVEAACRKSLDAARSKASATKPLRGASIVSASPAVSAEWVLHIQPRLDVGCVAPTTPDGVVSLCSAAVRAATHGVSLKGTAGVRHAEVIQGFDGRPAVRTYGGVYTALIARHDVAWERSICNDPSAAAALYGIENGAALLLHELRSVVSGDGVFQPGLAAHMRLIADAMCRTGVVNPINRHGLSRQDLSALRALTFEQITARVATYSLIGATDRLEGVTECLIVGKRPPVGTGAVTLVEQGNAGPARAHDPVVCTQPLDSGFASTPSGTFDADLFQGLTASSSAASGRATSGTRHANPMGSLFGAVPSRPSARLGNLHTAFGAVDPSHQIFVPSSPGRSRPAFAQKAPCFVPSSPPR